MTKGAGFHHVRSKEERRRARKHRGPHGPPAEDLRAAFARHGVRGVSPESPALHTQAVLQGAFVLAKAHGPQDGPHVARQSLDHLIRHVRALFGRDGPTDDQPQEENRP